MDFNTSYNKIVTDENMMEMIQHGDRGYPFKLYYDDLALFDFHCVEWHWHVGFEFVLIETGTVTFGIGEKQVTLEKGHGVFMTLRGRQKQFLSCGISWRRRIRKRMWSW